MVWCAKNFVLFMTVLLACATTTIFGKQNSYNNPAVSEAEGDIRFRKCCEKENKIPKQCKKLCTYGLTMSELRNAYMTGECSESSMLTPILRCANGNGKGSDCRQCCKDLHVTSSFNDPLCSPFCEKNPSVYTVSNEQFMRCGRKFHDILHCHLCGLHP